jgi:hypothetical protein
MTERVSQRTYTRKVYDLGGGRVRARCHAGHIHYRDDAGELADIDHTWEDRGAFWAMTRASYKMRVAKDFGAANLIEYRNRYEGASHGLVYEPHSLVWATGRDLSDVRPFRSQQSVQGVVTGPTIRYTDAFGPGLHFEVSLRGSGFTKELVIQRRNALELPPTPQHRLVLLSRYRPTGVSLKDTIGRTWAEQGEFDDANDDGFRLDEPNGKHSLIRPAYIVESDADETRHRCPVIWTARNGALWQAKVLPTRVLNTGTYPLRADTVTSYYAGAGDGYVEANDTTWDLTHDATDGATADYIGTNTRVSVGQFANWGIRRAFFPVDTSGIPDGATINSATFYAKTSTIGDNDDNDGDDFFVLVGPTSQADPTQLVTADFDTCGSVDAPQEITADRKDFSSIAAVGTYNSWVLNATGLGIISKTGYTLIGMREGHDVVDSAIVGGVNADNQIRFYTSEQAGTGDDPYLEVDYTPPGDVVAWMVA